jgi:Zn-dependent peptidase ImmA (M78 family)
MTDYSLSAAAHGLIVKLVDALVPNRDVQRVVDIVQIAKSLGAYDVVHRARTAHGFTEWTARGPRVVLGWAETEGRRRALLAHECGHLLLDPLLKPDALELLSEEQGRAWQAVAPKLVGRSAEDIQNLFRSTSLERLCDDFAYELVFPDRVASQLASAVRDIEGLSDCRTSMHVTLGVAVLKLNQFRTCNGLPIIGLIQTQRSAGRYWMASSSYGLPKVWRGRVVLTSPSSQMLDSFDPGSKNFAEIGLSNGETVVTVMAEIQKFREKATVMIDASALQDFMKG